MSRPLLLLASFVFCVADDAQPGGVKEKDLAAMQGDWKLIWLERDGQRHDAARNVLSIRGNKWGAKGREAAASFILDPGTTPKLIDVTSQVEGFKGRVTEGIYKLEGDTLITCLYLAEGVKQRPVEFKTKPGSDLLMYGWKRVER